MPIGKGKKSDFRKDNEKPHPNSKEVEKDEKSPIDRGKDFIKAGEN